MKKQAGIWLDLRNAWIIHLPVEYDGEIVVQHITSSIEEKAAIENTRMGSHWGPQGGNNQRSVEERLHQEEKRYFSDILQHIDPATDEVVIFGPSEAKHGLNNLLASQHHAPKVKAVEAADQMTQHQMKAWVRKFFGRPAARRRPKVGQPHQ